MSEISMNDIWTGAVACLINRPRAPHLPHKVAKRRLIKPSDFQGSRSGTVHSSRARGVYTMLIAPGTRYRSVNLYYSARTMRLPARVYLKLDPWAVYVVRGCAHTHVRGTTAGENLSTRCRRRRTARRPAFPFQANCPSARKKLSRGPYLSLLPFGVTFVG